MKIDESQIQLSGQSANSYDHARRERLRIATRDAAIDITHNAQTANATLSVDRVSLTDAARAMASQIQQGGAPGNPAEIKQKLAAGLATHAGANAAQAPLGALDISALSPEQGADMETNVKVLIIEALTGRKIVLFNPAHFQQHQAGAGRQAEQAMQRGHKHGNPQQNDADWGLAYDVEEITRESQTASFHAAGMVKTADGREINFETTLDMHRERISMTNFSLRAGNAQLTDPLVINFSGSAAELTQEKYDFDLDSDGSADQISFVKAGSGFLVYDKNGDGIATDGSELFGPDSGNGFAELAAYDQDQNGWIDENDSIYQALRIWSKTGQGQDQMHSLQQKNVGAIYLGNVGTEFDLKNAAGELQGQVRSTGVYLTEQGQAKTIQQIDLATVEPSTEAPAEQASVASPAESADADMTQPPAGPSPTMATIA